jgi:hypothetical protein
MGGKLDLFLCTVQILDIARPSDGGSSYCTFILVYSIISSLLNVNYFLFYLKLTIVQSFFLFLRRQRVDTKVLMTTIKVIRGTDKERNVV